MKSDKIELKIDRRAEYVIDVLMKHGYDAYVVGGCVRDLLLNKLFNEKAVVHDWDICTNAKPEEVLKIFREGEHLNVIETGLKHGTVTVMVEGNQIGDNVCQAEGFEVTTYRIDGDYSDGRRPDSVEFTSSLQEDLSRRDFTINAMAYNHRDGVVGVDGSIDDMRNKIIRCVGNAQDRFGEDSLRILRAMRFKAKLGYTIEASTSKAMFDLKGNLSAISNERKASELTKILLADYKIDVLFEYKDILFEIIPELKATDGFDQHNKHHVYDVYTHMIKAVEALGDCKDIKVLLAVFLHDIGKPDKYTFNEETRQGHFYEHGIHGAVMAEEILKRLKFSNDVVNDVFNLIKYHDNVTRHKPAIKRMLNRVGQEQFSRLLKIQRADLAAHSDLTKASRTELLDNIELMFNEVIEQAQAFSLKDLKVKGGDLIAIGYKPGKELGGVLNNLLDLVINDTILNERQALLDYAKKQLG